MAYLAYCPAGQQAQWPLKLVSREPLLAALLEDSQAHFENRHVVVHDPVSQRITGKGKAFILGSLIPKCHRAIKDGLKIGRIRNHSHSSRLITQALEIVDLGVLDVQPQHLQQPQAPNGQSKPTEG